MTHRFFAKVLLLGMMMWSMSGVAVEAGQAMKKHPFGKTSDGRPVELYTLTNGKGMEVAITTFGGAIVAIRVPDRQGKVDDVVLGYDNLEGYVSDKAFLGALIGRYGNRIAHGKFVLNGITYTLPKNDGDNTLHGGPESFNKRLWNAKGFASKDGQAIELSYLSTDGEAGFPGNLAVKVVYTLTNENELIIAYSATTDKDTIVNLTSHSYFNLAGQGNGDILHHQLMIRGNRLVVVDSSLIPTGELRPVKGSPFDFTHETTIGARINLDDPQLKIGHGYDHTWVLDTSGKGTPALAAEAYEANSGRVLEVLTTEPGVQFYTGNFLDGTIHGKAGKTYNRRYAFCLETQHFPDSPNHPAFPSTVLKPGQTYATTTIFKFSTR